MVALLLPLEAAGQATPHSSVSLSDAFDRMHHLLDSVDRKDRGLEQTYIIPERAGQNKVSWYGFQWQYIDAPAPGGGAGGIRLYYYKSAVKQAQRALPAIESAYARLVQEFAYQPTKRIPYFLYATQREFEATNIFEVGEGTLGVTSNERDLRMLVPYFGDHSKFIEVSTHEMVHQFTLQKLNDEAGAEQVSSAANALPLWFMEGIAEYYSKGGIDPETDLYLRDVVWNPDPKRHYEVLPFAEDRYRGYITTYKLGQARVAFIGEVYGREKIQGILENAYLMGSGDLPGGRSFEALVHRVLGEPIEQVDERWHSWLKRRYYPQYIATPQDLGQMQEIRNLPDEPEHFTTSPDGRIVLVRGIDREKGRARLYLFDLRDPKKTFGVASDSQPGIESLHPIEYAVGTVAPGIVVFSAQDRQGDSLYVRRYSVEERKGQSPEIHVGRLSKLRVIAPGGLSYVQIADPALSPDGRQIAFSGLLSGDAQADVWIVPVSGGEARRLTDDPYVERDLRWGADGIYCVSDATDHGRLNVFRIDVETGKKTQLTTAPRNDRYPYPESDGSVLYTSDAGGKRDVFRLRNGEVRRVTDFTTGLAAPAPAPKGRGLIASTFYGGRFRLVEVPKVTWLDSPPEKVEPPSGAVLDIPRTDFPAPPKEYNPLSLDNWRPEAGYVFGAGAGGAVAGRAAILFADLLRDNSLYLDVSVYGSFDYTQGLALFENRSRRYGIVFGAFHFVQQNLDALDPNLVYLQRDFGALGAIDYPLDRFRRVEATLSLGGTQRYCLTNFADQVVLNCQAFTAGPTYSSTAAWESQNGGLNFAVTPTLRYGYDTLRYDILAGPLDGSSAVFELGGGWLPWRSAVYGYARTDLEHFWQLIGRSNLSFRLAGAAGFAPDSAGRVWEKSFWLLSEDNLRGLYPTEYSRLTGRNYYLANLELHIPLDPFVHLFIFDYVAAVAAVDFGGVFNSFASRTLTYTSATVCGEAAVCQLTEPGAWYSRSLSGVLGVNFLFGPLVLRIHFGHPFGIGGLPTQALLTHTPWVTNITLRYFFQ